MTTARRTKRPSRARERNGSYEMWEIAGLPSIERVSSALRDGHAPPDRMFDYYLPVALRSVSLRHWTPLAVAARAAEWLNDLGVESVLDVGAGSGKFCVCAALASAAHFSGIEQRRPLVESARALAKTFAVDDRVTFDCVTFDPRALPSADAYYLYNPFGENLLRDDEQIDLSVEQNPARYVREVNAFEAALHALPKGAYVLTYNGFGGRMPATYTELRVDDSLPNVLRLHRA